MARKTTVMIQRETNSDAIISYGLHEQKVIKLLMRGWRELSGTYVAPTMVGSASGVTSDKLHITVQGRCGAAWCKDDGSTYNCMRKKTQI